MPVEQKTSDLPKTFGYLQTDLVIGSKDGEEIVLDGRDSERAALVIADRATGYRDGFPMPNANACAAAVVEFRATDSVKSVYSDGSREI